MNSERWPLFNNAPVLVTAENHTDQEACANVCCRGFGPFVAAPVWRHLFVMRYGGAVLAGDAGLQSSLSSCFCMSLSLRLTVPEAGSSDVDVNIGGDCARPHDPCQDARPLMNGRRYRIQGTGFSESRCVHLRADRTRLGILNPEIASSTKLDLLDTSTSSTFSQQSDKCALGCSRSTDYRWYTSIMCAILALAEEIAVCSFLCELIPVSTPEKNMRTWCISAELSGIP